MQFKVPQFLERETVIVFGLTFKRLAVFGVLGLVLFFLYYIIPRALFILFAVLATGGFVVCSFVKIKGQTVYEIVLHFFSFFASPRTYIWQKKEGAVPVRLRVERGRQEKEKKESLLAFVPRGRLGSLRARVDLGVKED